MPWSDDDLRRYLLRDPFLLMPDDEPRADCIRELSRIVPALQRRLLEVCGAMTSATGVAMLAYHITDRSRDPRRYWVVASTAPWQNLEEWIGDELIAMYRRAAR